MIPVLLSWARIIFWQLSFHSKVRHLIAGHQPSLRCPCMSSSGTKWQELRVASKLHPPSCYTHATNPKDQENSGSWLHSKQYGCGIALGFFVGGVLAAKSHAVCTSVCGMLFAMDVHVCRILCFQVCISHAIRSIMCLSRCISHTGCGIFYL